jgi:hypothetical protein
MHASGAERERFLERARFFFRNSIDTLAKAPTRTLARPVIVLLSSGRLHSWFEARPEASMPAEAAPIGTFGSPAAFVSQKERAKRRLVLLGVGGAALATAGLLAIVLR